MKNISHTSPFGGTYKLSFQLRKYKNGQHRLDMIDNEDGLPYCTASSMIDTKLEDDEIAIKNYSENQGILESLIEAEIVEQPHRYVSSGYVLIPICKLKA